jgi:hypothetical protein
MLRALAAQKYQDDPVRLKPGGKEKTWEWTERLNCHHAGVYRDQRNANTSPSKRRPHQSEPSVKNGCSAHIWLWKFIGQDQVQVEYTWRHAHSIGTLMEMRLSMMPIRLQNWLKDLVAQGLDWPQIKMRLQLDTETLHCLGNTSTALTDIPETLRVAQKDVYNLIRERLHKLAILDPKNGHRSLQLWKEKLTKQGYSVYYEPVTCQAEGENHYVFALVSPWQREVKSMKL